MEDTRQAKRVVDYLHKHIVLLEREITKAKSQLKHARSVLKKMEKQKRRSK